LHPQYINLQVKKNFSGSISSESEGTSGHRGKKKTLEELFKPPLDIMFKGDWQSVRDSASAAKKWLMVNIQVTQNHRMLIGILETIYL
jgi:hypothetical protein